jgi:hypothetical protein
VQSRLEQVQCRMSFETSGASAKSFSLMDKQLFVFAKTHNQCVLRPDGPSMRFCGEVRDSSTKRGGSTWFARSSQSKLESNAGRRPAGGRRIKTGRPASPAGCMRVNPSAHESFVNESSWAFWQQGRVSIREGFCGLCLAWNLTLTVVSDDFAATGALPIMFSQHPATKIGSLS